jgi:hypothetical protein
MMSLSYSTMRCYYMVVGYSHMVHWCPCLYAANEFELRNASGSSTSFLFQGMLTENMSMHAKI